MPLIYDELHRIAARQLRGDRVGRSLSPTEMISEAYMRLMNAAPPEGWNGRVHFFAIAARTMRRVLVDHARRRSADKRGGGERPITLEDVAQVERPDELLLLDQALAELEKLDERKARIVELYYFGGLTQPEIAEALEVHVNTVARDLRRSEAWLHRVLAT